MQICSAWVNGVHLADADWRCEAGAWKLLLFSTVTAATKKGVRNGLYDTAL